MHATQERIYIYIQLPPPRFRGYGRDSERAAVRACVLIFLAEVREREREIG